MPVTPAAPSAALLTTAEVAQLLGMSVRALTHWRTKHIGPKWVPIGDDVHYTVRYRRDEVDRYIDACAKRPQNIPESAAVRAA